MNRLAARANTAKDRTFLARPTIPLRPERSATTPVQLGYYSRRSGGLLTGNLAPEGLPGTMHKERPQPFENEHRLVSLNRQDVEDLRRLLAKLSPAHLYAARKGEVRADNDSEPLLQRARDALEMRRKRIAIFGPQMFAEPAWEMLLILYLSEGGQRHSQSSLSELSGASRSTGMRWIDYLVGHGLMLREEHPTDKRRNFVNLSKNGRELLELYLSETS